VRRKTDNMEYALKKVSFLPLLSVSEFNAVTFRISNLTYIG